MSAAMHTCDLDWGRTVLLMLCVLLMLKLRLWEDVRVWVGAIKSNRSVEAGPDPGAEIGVRLGPGAVAVAEPPVMALKRSFPLLSTVWADAGIWPPGKAFHSPKSPLEADATAMENVERVNYVSCKHEINMQMWLRSKFILLNLLSVTTALVLKFHWTSPVCCHHLFFQSFSAISSPTNFFLCPCLLVIHNRSWCVSVLVMQSR